MKSLYLFLIIGFVVVVAGWWLLHDGAALPSEETSAVGVVGEPYDVVTDFYTAWLDAVRATSTDPYAEGLATADFLETPVRDRLVAGQSAAVDPVLCQETAPGRIAVKEIFSSETEVEFYVIGRGEDREKLAGQALVKLMSTDGAWVVTDIQCGFGETAPEREFSFEREGFLIKDSLPEGFDTSNWHLVFEQDGQNGYTVPLYFSDATNCGTADEPITCDESRFVEAKKVSVKGEMIEAGLNVLWFEEVIE